jgi:hypothetical protein
LRQITACLSACPAALFVGSTPSISMEVFGERVVQAVPCRRGFLPALVEFPTLPEPRGACNVFQG